MHIRTDQLTLSTVQHLDCQWATMVGANMSIAVHVMIIILKQQEIDVEEVTSTIHTYINQFCRSELRFCTPEMRGILASLLQKHLKCTKQAGLSKATLEISYEFYLYERLSSN